MLDVFLSLLHSTSINMCNCHCFVPDVIAACNTEGSCDSFLVHLPTLLKKGAMLFSMKDFNIYTSVQDIRTSVSSFQSVLVTALCSSGVCVTTMIPSHTSSVWRLCFVRDGFSLDVSS